VLRAARAMRDADAILLLADDPVARTDVPALARARGWTSCTQDADGHVLYRLDKPD
jgi:tRNA 2-thiouridine synthesizing protein A